jgi:hypothetical protein
LGSYRGLKTGFLKGVPNVNRGISRGDPWFRRGALFCHALDVYPRHKKPHGWLRHDAMLPRNPLYTGAMIGRRRVMSSDGDWDKRDSHAPASTAAIARALKSGSENPHDGLDCLGIFRQLGPGLFSTGSDG